MVPNESKQYSLHVALWQHMHINCKGWGWLISRIQLRCCFLIVIFAELCELDDSLFYAWICVVLLQCGRWDWVSRSTTVCKFSDITSKTGAFKSVVCKEYSCRRGWRHALSEDVLLELPRCSATSALGVLLKTSSSSMGSAPLLA